MIDYEKAYKAALKTATQWFKDGCTDKEKICLECVFPELRESEDERIRKFLLEHSIEMIAGLESDISISVYDGVKGHDPDAEEELEKWRRARAWLEKQKEQKPIEPSDEELQRHQDELYDFKVFATKQAKEHHISFVHDFEWNNFCAELLSYFNEQKPAEWSEEDEKMLNNIEYILHKDISYTPPAKPNSCTGSGNAYYTHQTEIDWLKSLRSPKSSDNWKPSEEQMKALQNAIALTACDKELVRLYNQLKKL